MAVPEFDLFVIGGGSAGVRAARMAAQSGARVAVAPRNSSSLVVSAGQATRRSLTGPL
jgi:pyruvate/2-oxoglutarate dehydrogenase complex dihydrolipoamide dehydrogenase (E3) component